MPSPGTCFVVAAIGDEELRCLCLTAWKIRRMRQDWAPRSFSLLP